MSDKILTINRFIQGESSEGQKSISWHEFVMDMEFSDPEEMNQAAIWLLQGEFLYDNKGEFGYHVLGLKEEDGDD